MNGVYHLNLNKSYTHSASSSCVDLAVSIREKDISKEDFLIFELDSDTYSDMIKKPVFLSCLHHFKQLAFVTHKQTNTPDLVRTFNMVTFSNYDEAYQWCESQQN